jgi:alkylation response protein AidB-like acyl-CoA dehydrogenase
MSASQNLIEMLGSRTGLEAGLSEEITLIADMVHKFAAEVLRPIGQQLDRMSPEEVISADSPLWDVYRGFGELGISAAAMVEMDPTEAAILSSVLFEELAWGDAGLAVSLGVSMTPLRMAYFFDNKFLIENIPPTAIGCWAITEPDHGSDMADFDHSASLPGGDYGRPNCIAAIDGDTVTINGQKAAWVSNGTIAEYAALFCACDRGNGPEQVALVVPLHLEGVSRGKPLDKLGQRALPQGEIFFDNVTLSTDWLLAPPEMYTTVAGVALTDANTGMGMMFTGLARAAFELALDYAHERKQGGGYLVQHPGVRARLLDMYRQVEASRALARRVAIFNTTENPIALLGAISAKITTTQAAFDVASDALQMFGGNGLTTEYPVEKLLRDARASLIEDGCNEVLAIKGGSMLVQKL